MPPRIRGGVCSAMYSGATNEAVPTDRPSTNLAATSHGTFCANAAASAPTTYTQPDRHVVHLRLILSER